MITAAQSQARIALLQEAASREAPAPALLYTLAAALAETGAAREAAEVFRRAYQVQPSGCPLLSVEASIESGDLARLRDQAAALVSHGVAYSTVIAALAIAEARSGNRAAVEFLVDYDRLFSSTVMAAPEGGDQAAFMRALAAELRVGVHYHDNPSGRAIRRAWKRSIDGDAEGPAIRAWLAGVRDAVDRYAAALPDDPGHPFVASRPASYAIEAWAVVSNGDSFHTPHIHQTAWMSGVYYVVCPAVSRVPGSRRGWLQVGPPAKHGVSADQGWGARMVAPEPGALVLMPAYFFHGTEPMGADEERICIAFDVVPAELAGPGTGEAY
jgi:hypothetical protein